MRVATLILGLVLMVLLDLQSCAATVGDAIANTPTSQQGGSLGIFMAALFLIGAAFALYLPLVSFVSFLIAGLVGLLAGSSTSFADLTIWGIASLILAGERSARGAQL